MSAYPFPRTDWQEPHKLPSRGVAKPTPKAGWVCPTCERVWAWWFPGPCDHGKAKEDA